MPMKRTAWHHLPALRKPTQAQLDAGNYPKEPRTFQGLRISIENPRGSTRSGRSRSGQEWSVQMQHDYGYIRGTRGSDGDHYDCYIGPVPTATHAFIINTMKPPTFTVPDEQKVMLGFNNEADARAAFLAHYNNPGFFGSMRTMEMAEFKAKVKRTAEPGHDGMVKALVLFFKAHAAGQGSLFSGLAQVRGHTRGGVYVAPYIAHKKRSAPAPMADGGLIPAPAMPDEEAAEPNKQKAALMAWNRLFPRMPQDLPHRNTFALGFFHGVDGQPMTGPPLAGERGRRIYDAAKAAGEAWRAARETRA